MAIEILYLLVGAFVLGLSDVKEPKALLGFCVLLVVAVKFRSMPAGATALRNARKVPEARLQALPVQTEDSSTSPGFVDSG